MGYVKHNIDTNLKIEELLEFLNYEKNFETNSSQYKTIYVL